MRLRRQSIAAAGAAAVLAAAGVLHLTGGTAARAQAGRAPSGFLAVVSTFTGDADGGDVVQGPQRLVVVHRDGSQTVLHTVHPDPTTAVGAMQLLDVSADRRTALVQDLGRRLSDLYTVDTTTGQVTHRLPGVRRLIEALLEPDGSGVLEIRQSTTGYRNELDRTTWDGQVTARTWVRTSATWITPAGDVLVPTTSRSRHGLRLFDGRTGALERRIGTGGRDCHPVRSLGAAQVLLACAEVDDPVGATLVRLDPAIGTLVPVTRPHPSDPRFYGDIDARITPDGVFVQEAGPCGWSWFTRQRPDGTLVVQKVRGAVGEVDLVGRLGRRPVIMDTTSCDTSGSQREVLATYDVRTRRQHVLHAWSAGHQVGPVVPLGERRVSF